MEASTETIEKIDYASKMQLRASAVLRKHDRELTYHNIAFYNRMITHCEIIGEHFGLTEDEFDDLFVAVWTIAICYNEVISKSLEEEFEGTIGPKRVAVARKELEAINFPEERMETILHFVAFRITAPKSRIELVYSDANLRDISTGGRDTLKAFYQELLLRDVKISQKSWYDFLLETMDSYGCRTGYGEQYIMPVIRSMKAEIEEERKDLEKQEHLILKKELEISSKELKSLKKNLTKLKTRDARGVQTLFRNLSKNHYTLTQMVDRKANIMITVNSIILSLVIGGVFGTNIAENGMSVWPVVVLASTSIVSILFAINAIRPNRTQGEFNEEQIRHKQGNPLYFGNFHNMTPRDYEWAMLQILNDADYMYSAMIRDVYFLGQSIHRKHQKIRVSLNVFIIGFVLAFALALMHAIMRGTLANTIAL
ncbi:hypothetical protein HZ996_05720 [Cryomorphaceae bacterium]|nr:hypothetical protein HZ996_05720 [Cryomorphaceae bacterium]